jgi:peptidoglycan hydrolase-like protein with peptidoglycan-binding domain
MKISTQDLTGQVDTARSNGWLPLMAAAEKRHKLPAGLLLAIASRETNMRDVVGDGGHGRGLFQIDDRWQKTWLSQHGALGAGQTPKIADATEFAADMLAGNIAYGKQKGVRAADLVKFACSAYNAGPGGAWTGYQAGDSDKQTANGDYGSDVVGRLAAIQGLNGGGQAGAGVVLKQGVRSPQVTKLKQDLQAWYDSQAPGAWASFKVAPGPLYGAALVDAVKDFQLRNALDPDGQAGDATLAALAGGSTHVPKPPPKPKPAPGGGVLELGSRGPDVTRLKKDLQAWFDQAAPGTWETFGVTGGPAFGPTLDRAVREFQKRTGLTVDGQVGPQTLSALEGTGGSAPATDGQPAAFDWPDLHLDSPKKVGSTGVKVRLIQGWLFLHDFKVTADGQYGKVTADAVRAFQRQKGLPPTGVVDDATYAKLVHPMVAALSPIAPAGKSLGQLVVQVARQHLAQKPVEVGDNAGPWVRLYTNGQEGHLVYWCAGFATFCIQQAADTLGVPNPIPRTLACDAMATTAGPRLLKSPPPSQRARVTPGGFFLVRAGKGETRWTYEHTGIVVGVGADSVQTIEGNTNTDGSPNGYEVAGRYRPWSNDFIVIQ